MNVAQTSLDAFQEIKGEGKLGRMQELVFRGFLEYGPCTNLELSEELGIPINVITGRTNELYKKNMIISNLKRTCKISGRRALCWEVPDTISKKRWQE